jgi:putative acyl-CoA dehydrogenase
VVESLALALQASLLARVAPSACADAFVSARIDEPRLFFGALPATLDVTPILERSRPA